MTMSDQEHAAADRRREGIEAGVDWINGREFAVQIDGHDLIHVELNLDGSAEIRVFASTFPEAGVLAEHTVRWDERSCEVDDCTTVAILCDCGSAHCPTHPHVR